MQRTIPTIAIFISICAILFTSCEMLDDTKSHEQKVIGIHVSDNPVTKARSEVGKETLANVIKMDGGVLYEYVSDSPFNAFVETKGQVITTSETNAINTDGKSFTINAWLGQSSMASADYPEPGDISNRHFLSETATRSGGEWNIGTNYWRNGIETTFWSYQEPEVGTLTVTDHGPTPTDAALSTLNFTYSLPASGGGDNDAALLSDLIIAYNKDSRTTSATNGDLDIHFYHPLAAVKFAIGNINGGTYSNEADDEYVEITKVELVGVKTTGAFVASGESSNKCTFSCTPSGSGDYSQEATRSQIANGFFTDSGSSYVFFMIPQNLSGVQAIITTKRKKKYLNSDGTPNHYSDSREIESTYIANLSGIWESGKYYTYKIDATVYFGGETVNLPSNPYTSNSETIGIDENGNISIDAKGSISLNDYVAPLNTKGVNVIKLTITHAYNNKNETSHRQIWLENANDNPEYTNETDTPGQKYLSTISTKESSLVIEAKETYPELFTSAYTGILGEYETIKKSYIATSNDHNMNLAQNLIKDGTTTTSEMYFYLGGKFDKIRIHFSYGGETGTGAIGWEVSTPVFNIAQTVY